LKKSFDTIIFFFVVLMVLFLGGEFHGNQQQKEG